MYTFFWNLYELTGDVAFVQVLYGANANSTNNLPYDLFADDPISFQKNVQDLIDEVGTPNIECGSINKKESHLAILRSQESAVWLHYDAGGRHSHRDGMNLGLFAKGLDLMPDFGYPPVQYGGWNSLKANWYKMSAAHNTVVVDGQNHRVANGKTTLWADGEGVGESHHFRAICVSASGLIELPSGIWRSPPSERLAASETLELPKFERTVALVDISDTDSYIVDVFRVVGGNDHAKFFHSHFGTITTEGLNLNVAEDYGHGSQMRNFYEDQTPQPGWYVDWKIDDRYGLLPPDSDVHLRYTDLTTDASAFIAEGWVSASGNWSSDDAWIPRVMVRRQSKTAPLASTFVAVIEPYEDAPKITQIRRLQLETEDGEIYSDANVAIEIQLADGRRDLFVEGK